MYLNRIHLLPLFLVILLPLAALAQDTTLTVTSGGNVGIGTTTPETKLDISVDVDRGVLRLTHTKGPVLRSTLTSTLANFGTITNHPFYLLTNNRNRLAISENGNVGIGTTRPTATLHIKGDNGIRINGSADNFEGDLRMVNTIAEESSGEKDDLLITADGSLLIKLDANNNGAGVPGGFNIYDRENNALLHVTESNGNVGIGTNIPKANLDIHGVNDGSIGSLIVRRGSRNSYIKITGPRGSPYSSKIIVSQFNTGTETSAITISNENNANFGNVGIGTTSPSEKLHVVGNIFADGDISATGNIGPCSSRDYKDDIQSLQLKEAANALQSLNPVKFTYKSEQEKELHLGFIAEDVPDLVATSSRKTLSTMDIVAVLTKVVQEQQKQMAIMQQELNLLKNKIGE